MKKINNLSQTTKRNLGNHLYNYMRTERMSQSEFAKKIDAELYKDYNPNRDKFEESPTSNKTMQIIGSRWVKFIFLLEINITDGKTII